MASRNGGARGECRRQARVWPRTFVYDLVCGGGGEGGGGEGGVDDGGHTGSGDTGGGGDGSASAEQGRHAEGGGGSGSAPAGPGPSRAAEAGPKEAAITWEKLSKTTLGEAPILLGSAAVSAMVTGVTAVASVTPADIAENVKGLASLKTIGLGPSEKKGHFDEAPREKIAPQFSHLAGRGGADAAAFGGQEILDDDDDGQRQGLSTPTHSNRLFAFFFFLAPLK